MDEDVNPFQMQDGFSEFTLAEIHKMECSFRKQGETSLSQEFCQKLATKFSCSLHRSGRPSIKWEQVYGWFQDRQKQKVAQAIASPSFIKDLVGPSNAALGDPGGSSPPLLFLQLNVPSRVPSRKTVTDITLESSLKSKDESIAELLELMFEARSSKDFAWYDVATFLNYRVMNSGELEVRVRFAGFGNDQDEWVNVRRAVRQRSIPLEASECQKVEIGDLVLCYRETDKEAIYCDARIVEIQRRLHDIEGCKCIFGVRYVHDHFEDKVELNRICCRPT